MNKFEINKRLIGERVRRLREARSVTPSRTGVSRSCLFYIETSRMMPSLTTLEKVAAALGVGLIQFFLTESDAELFDSAFVRELLPFLPNLSLKHRQLILATLEAAPRQKSFWRAA